MCEPKSDSTKSDKGQNDESKSVCEINDSQEENSIGGNQSEETTESEASKLEKSGNLGDTMSEAKYESYNLKLIAMGSPVPSSTGAKKPPLEKFAKGMGNLIYFENLPNSTGVFEKMRGVIYKIRDKLSQ